MLIPFIRTVILYLFVITAIRLMGKRQVAEMQPTELVVTILVSAVASVPMQDLDIPISYGIIPILTLISAEMLMSFVTLKFPKFRRILTGNPVILIENGVLIQKGLAETRLTLDDLQEDLRLKNIYDIRDIRHAQIETSGQISIRLYDEKEPPTAKDMGINLDNSPIFYTIISDGYLREENLKNVKKDEGWLKSILKVNGLTDKKQAFLLLCDEKGTIILVKKEGK